MARHIGTANLKPVKTKEEAKERGRNGGIRSGEAKREKKLLSERYIIMLADKFDIDGETIDDIIKGVLKRKDSASVSMLKEMREASEGNKMELTARPVVIDSVYESLKGNNESPKKEE